MTTQERVVLLELHHTRAFRNAFISALSDPIATLVICSPFFDKLPPPFKDVIEFCYFMKRRGAGKIQIITRPPGCDATAMTLECAKILAGQEVEIFVKSRPNLHAKLYHIQYERGTFKTFVGSANFTNGGFERNLELMAELEGSGFGSAMHREIASMQSSGGTMSFNAWIAKGQPDGVEGTV